jgi:short-subunit dehydrogenase
VTTFFGKKIPVKLDRNSLVILTGGCMGIGRQMALELARLYNCRLLIIDRRKDLFAKIEQEIKEAGGSCECRFADLGNKESVHGLNKYILGRN